MLDKIGKAIAMVYDLGLSMLRHTYKPNEDEFNAIVENKQRYRDMFMQDSGNALVNHLRAFAIYDPANKKFVITGHSMHTTLTQLGFDEKGADQVTSASMGLPYLNDMVNITHCPFGFNGDFSPDIAPHLEHPHDTGLYKLSGEFNQGLFETVKSKSFADKDGKLVISDDAFVAAIKELVESNHRWDKKDFVLWFIGKTGHDGEFESLRSLIMSRWIDGQPHALIEDIQNFYQHTATIYYKKVDGELTLPEKPKPALDDTTLMMISEMVAKSQNQDDKPAISKERNPWPINAMCQFAYKVLADENGKLPTSYAPQHLAQQSFLNQSNIASTCPTSTPAISPTPTPAGHLG